MKPKETMNQPISKLERYLFEHGKISQAKISKLSKIAPATISHIVTGGLWPNPEQASAIVRALRELGHDIETTDIFYVIKRL